ncbi:hypothetical protein SSABA_v1c04270 [Spiroplasma sabaudiense Ar-1343]|uniref:Restriction endonuclease n=1 Tax=Spiroplasma sabaudiense Ar-1343 TaxID=1276257 RepID=W6AA17_9MOLU|nr:hypothetical protein [Spiroplasma sabaudiense]AHI53836.1 hypothetical protein SSABA_v1c04270 [Spiroplasma sabaudiense Ar-1343]
MEPNYDLNLKMQLKNNLENFDINSESERLKIEKFCEKFNFKLDEVYDEIKKSKFLKAFFIKNPTKQNIYEKTAFEFISSIEGVHDAENLPNGSKTNSVYISDQEVRKGRDVPISIRKKAKSIDFKFMYKDLKTEFYVFHKYTGESGGAQDNQKNDIINSMNAAKSAHPCDKDFVLFYICDGAYYNKEKMIELGNNITGISNFYLLKSGDLENKLKSIFDGYKCI